MIYAFIKDSVFFLSLLSHIHYFCCYYALRIWQKIMYVYMHAKRGMSVCLLWVLCMFLSAPLFMCLFVSQFVCINVRMYVCMSLRMHQLYRLVVTRYYPSFLLFIPFERHAPALCTTYICKCIIHVCKMNYTHLTNTA